MQTTVLSTKKWVPTAGVHDLDEIDIYPDCPSRQRITYAPTSSPCAKQQDRRNDRGGCSVHQSGGESR